MNCSALIILTFTLGGLSKRDMTNWLRFGYVMVVTKFKSTIKKVCFGEAEFMLDGAYASN